MFVLEVASCNWGILYFHPKCTVFHSLPHHFQQFPFNQPFKWLHDQWYQCWSLVIKLLGVSTFCYQSNNGLLPHHLNPSLLQRRLKYSTEHLSVLLWTAPKQSFCDTIWPWALIYQIFLKNCFNILSFKDTICLCGEGRPSAYFQVHLRSSVHRIISEK